MYLGESVPIFEKHWGGRRLRASQAPGLVNSDSKTGWGGGFPYHVLPANMASWRRVGFASRVQKSLSVLEMRWISFRDLLGWCVSLRGCLPSIDAIVLE